MNKEQIFEAVKQYYNENHSKEEYKEGDRINYAGRVYDAEEMCNLVDSALDFWLTAGKYTAEFEKKLGEYLNIPFVSLVNSGSSANLLAVMALTSHLLGDRKLKRGDEIITVAAAFPTTVAPIIQCGAVPVFVDINVPSYNIDGTLLEKAYTEKTKAVFLAHSLGNPFDIEAVKAFCDAHGLWLIEDNCDALGAEYTINGVTKKTGTIGDIGTSSFYPAHHLTMGEGGAVYTANPLLNKIVRSMRDWGRDCVCNGGQDNKCGHRFNGQYGTLPVGYDHKYVYSHIGFNLKATDMQASIGVAQLKKLPDFVTKRRNNWDYLYENLDTEEVRKVLNLPEKQKNSNPSWFGFIMSVKPESKKTRDEIVAVLEKYNVQTRALFAGNITRHPCFTDMELGKDYRVVGELTQTDYVMNNGFWVGVYPGMTGPMLDEMIKRIKESIQ